jgi:phosphoglucosamine mutase
MQVDEVRKVAGELEETLANRGRLLLRYSGTEPLARIMIEGQDQAEIENYAKKLASVIELVLGTSEPRRQ